MSPNTNWRRETKEKKRRFSSALENKERVADAVLCICIYATRCYDSRINSRVYIITPATVVVVVVRCRTEKIKTFEFLSSEVLMRAGTLFFFKLCLYRRANACNNRKKAATETGVVVCVCVESSVFEGRKRAHAFRERESCSCVLFCVIGNS